MKINIVSFHGLYSQGENLSDLVERLVEYAKENDIDVVSSQHDYPRLNATMGYFRWSRDIVRDYILKCLALEYRKHPDRKLIVLWHSNATWGGSRAVGKYYSHSYWDRETMMIHRIILFGSTIKRKWNWGLYSAIEVVNFVGTKDRVVWFSKLFKMGWSGRKGFKKEPNNLTQVYRPWKHSDFVLPENFDVIKEEVFKGVI